MLKIKKYKLLLIIALSSNIFASKSNDLNNNTLNRIPKLTLMIVIDQFGYHYLNKLAPYLNGGLKFLLNNGVNYKSAFFPHSIPSTAPGHAMLSTGTWAFNHGIVGNQWYDNNGKAIPADYDTGMNTAVFKPDNSLYDYSRSAKNTMVDGLSDQLIINSYNHSSKNVWSLSLKSRAAIAMASKLGKAIWFDEKTGNFTSSKYYFDKLPEWLLNFNKHEKTSRIKSFTWNPIYPKDSKVYDFEFINNYEYSSGPQLIGQKIELDQKNKDYDKDYTLTPMANKNLINLAKTCIINNIPKNDTEHLIIWLSLSSLDKVGHKFGPWSQEAIDTIYQMDSQLKTLIDFIYSKFKPEDVLFTLTADHGVMPITQLLSQKGLDIIHRYTSQNLIKELNNIIKEKYNISSLINNFKEPQFYLDQKKLEKIDKKTLNYIYQDIKNYLTSLPGIRKAWTFEELSNAIFDPEDTDIYLKRELYAGRSGQIFYSVVPYTMVDNHELGTSHNTKYNNDTQVPLIFYQKNLFENKNIYQNVYMTQFSPTLANILNVPRPSCANANILPGLFS